MKYFLRLQNKTNFLKDKFFAKFSVFYLISYPVVELLFKVSIILSSNLKKIFSFFSRIYKSLSFYLDAMNKAKLFGHKKKL